MISMTGFMVLVRRKRMVGYTFTEYSQATHIPLEVLIFWFVTGSFWRLSAWNKKGFFSLIVTIRSMLRQHMQDYPQGHRSFDMDLARFSLGGCLLELLFLSCCSSYLDFGSFGQFFLVSRAQFCFRILPPKLRTSTPYSLIRSWG